MTIFKSMVWNSFELFFRFHVREIMPDIFRMGCNYWDESSKCKHDKNKETWLDSWKQKNLKFSKTSKTSPEKPHEEGKNSEFDDFDENYRVCILRNFVIIVKIFYKGHKTRNVRVEEYREFLIFYCVNISGKIAMSENSQFVCQL